MTTKRKPIKKESGAATMSTKTKQIALSNLIAYGILAVLFAYAFYPTFAWMVDRWLAKDSYFSHGFLVPLVTLYWLNKQRIQLAQTETRSQKWGLAIMIAGGLLQLASAVLRIYFLSAVSFVIILFGGVAYLFGRKIIGKIWFPILFLLVMVPLPLLVISHVTLKMKFFVSAIATYLINAIGIRAVQEGSYVFTPNAAMMVGDPCSGLRSFLAFIALGLVFAYEGRFPAWKRILIVACGLPLAILSNVLRVFALGVLGEIYGMEFTKGFVHDASGFVVFALAFLVMMLIRNKLEEPHRA